MSLSWHQRKERLAVLLKSDGDDDADGLVLDRLMHGQTVIGKTAKTTEVDSLRFQDKDLDHVGTLDHGQYGAIDVVTCRINNCVYVRKSVDKKFASRTRDQCSPQFERDLLLQALKTQSPWAPHLLCAFQTPTHLKLVMDYAEGGTLWDVLESSPLDGRILEADLRWWMPQVVSAIHWCHSQGFVHRDIKPHNFVLTTNAHILLIDFGSAAPLLPPNDDGSQLIPKRHCLVPCGTCDYISPEILQAHEEALVQMEMDSDDDDISAPKSSAQDSAGYGLETDWWSLGAMLYEMAYGVAPFFAPDIRSTYLRIMNHEKSLKFDKNVAVSHEFQHFLRRLLTTANKRLGRRNVMEVTDHPIFEGIDWRSLQSQTAPSDLHLPQFVYSEPKAVVESQKLVSTEELSNSSSQGFAFSALFQSSAASPGLSILRPSPTSSAYLHSSLSSSTTSSSFIGFSWGPSADSFPRVQPSIARSPSPQFESQPTPSLFLRTPAYPQRTPVPASRNKSLAVPLTWGPGAFSTPSPLRGYNTPMKPYAASPHATLPRTSTIRRTAPRRNVSDREAMKQLVDCVGISARKKVLESGKKPKFLSIFAKSGSTNGTGKSSGVGTLRKELRFDKFSVPIPGPDYSVASSAHDKSKSRSRSNSASQSFSRANSTTNLQQLSESELSDLQHFSNPLPSREEPAEYHPDDDHDSATDTETTDSEGGGHPPSPSPSPRPGSAMSMMSMTMLSRRSLTPTVSGYLSALGSGTLGPRRTRSHSGSGLSALIGTSSGDRSATATITMTSTTNATTTNATTPATSSGFLTVPSTAAADKNHFQLEPPPALQYAVEHKVNSAFQQVPTFHSLPPTEVRTLSNDVMSELASAVVPASDPLLDALERRHSAMMESIKNLERRLHELSPFIHGP